MFKRITTFLTVLFMGLVLTVRSPVKADTFSIPFSAIPDLLNAFYTVAAGGKIEFSALIGNITGIDDFLENLHDYYDKNYTQPILQRTQNLIDIGLSGLALDGIDSIDSVNNLTIPITPQDIANFIGYDVNWADRYNNVDSITVNPDPAFISYINLINGTSGSGLDFFWKNNVSFPLYLHNEYNISLNSPEYSYFVSSNANNILSSANNTNPMYYCPLTDIHINNINGTYTINETVSYTTNISLPRLWGNRDTYSSGFSIQNSEFRNSGVVYSIDTNTFNFSYSSNTLSNVFQYISNKCRNVNIYVDGDLWAYVGYNPSPGISLNDYIEVGDTGNITYGVFPLTSTGDIGLDLAKWGEYIYNQCISGVDTLTMDTVIDDGWDLVDTEDGERAITEEDEEDVAKVIHGFVDTTATTPTPTPDIGDPPVLKIIPPILELPDEIWPDGGRDTTVLAQMVHATDVAIPNDIMTIIWSTIGLLVVGGLISILHK